jgi:hypothetical protein
MIADARDAIAQRRASFVALNGSTTPALSFNWRRTLGLIVIADIGTDSGGVSVIGSNSYEVANGAGRGAGRHHAGGGAETDTHRGYRRHQ